MGLFDRRHKQNDIEILQNAINVNDLNEQMYFKPFVWNLKKGRLNFSNFFVQLITNRIFNGLENVTWDTTEVNYLGSDICNFIERNKTLLVWSYWKDGYAVVIYEDSGLLRLPQVNEIRLDSNGYVINRNAIVIYSDPYVTERASHFTIISPILKNINTNLNNSNYVTENLGALGILSSKAVPLSNAGKNELNQRLTKEYGLNDDQFRFILTNQEMAYTPIQLPIKDLEFNDKVKDDINWLCNFFCISPDMVFGGSTFNNSSEAVKSFYRTCIQPLSEMLLKLARTTFVYADNQLKPSTIITYRITNIPELNMALSVECAEKSAYLDLLMKLEQTGIDVSDDIDKLYKTTKKMLENV